MSYWNLEGGGMKEQGSDETIKCDLREVRPKTNKRVVKLHFRNPAALKPERMTAGAGSRKGAMTIIHGIVTLMG